MAAPIWEQEQPFEFLSHSFYNVLPKSVRKTPEIYFVGTASAVNIFHDLKQVLDGKDFSVNIISKSGTTTEPAIASVYLRKCSLKNMARKKPTSAIYATTDKAKGALRTWQTKKDMRNSLCRMTWRSFLRIDGCRPSSDCSKWSGY